MLEPSHHTFDTIWGHEPVKKLVRRMLASNRLPHAMLLHGPDGVGKRSLAFAMAKLILSAGLRVPGGTIAAPRGARYSWHLDEPARSDNDMFGGGEGMDDLFGEQPDLFAEPKQAAPPPPPETPKEEAKPKRARKSAKAKKEEPPALEAKQAQAETAETKPKASRKKAAAPKDEAPAPPAEAPAPAPAPAAAPRSLAIDPRVDKLVAKSYPVQYAGDMPIMSGFADLNIIEPAPGKKGIRVEQVRALTEEIGYLAPIESTWRVVLIFGADTITPSAANSLLKLLEEPPSFLVLILVTDSPYRVLETIRSRCASLPCHPVDRDELTHRLVQEERCDPSHARVAASLAEGRPGVALSYLSGKALEQRQEILEARLGVDRRGLASVPMSASRVLKAAGSVGTASTLLLALARDRLVRRFAPGVEHLLINGDLAARFDEFTPDPADLCEEAERLLDALRLSQHPAIPAAEPAIELALWPG